MLTLAVGIAASTALFSAVEAVLLRSLPFRGADRLVFLWWEVPAQGADEVVGSLADFLSWRAESRSFEDLAAFNVGRGTSSSDGAPEEIQGAVVTANFFSLLGAEAALGRTFEPDLRGDRDARSLVVSHGFWKSRLGGSPRALGTKVLLSGEPYTLIGVLPAGFRQPEPISKKEPQFWRVLSVPADAARGDRSYRIVGRLRPGVGLDAARAELRVLSLRLEERYPATNQGWIATMTPMRDQLYGDLRLPLALLLVSALTVFAIAAANGLFLQLARQISRRPETAVRLALGARPAQLARTVWLEILAVVGTAGILGLSLAAGSVRALRSLAPGDAPGLGQAAVDAPVFLFWIGLLAASALLLGLAVVPRAAGRRPGGASRGGPGRGERRLQAVVVIAESALALPLLVLAGLLMQKALELGRIDPGFRPERLLGFRISLPEERYPDSVATTAFWARLGGEIRRLPGIEGVAWTSSVPLSGLNDHVRSFTPEGGEHLPPGEQPSAHYRVIAGPYFATAGIPLLEGTAFSPAVGEENPATAVISRSLASRLWPGRSPVGRHLRFAADGPWFTIVGEVGDLVEGEPPASVPTLYVPLSADPWRRMGAVVRTAGEPLVAVPSLRRAAAQLDSELPLADMAPLSDMLRQSRIWPRFQADAVAALAAAAWLLAGLGVFALTTYQLADRRRELALRLALGARRRTLLGGLLRSALAAAFTALALGFLPVLWALITFGHLPPEGRWSTHLLLAALLLVATHLAATALPARRLSRIEPMPILRDEWVGLAGKRR